MKKRNCTIDLMKFGMALVIAIFHFYQETHEHFKGGFFAVEFFILAASLFFFSKLERESVKLATAPDEGNSYIYIYIRNRFMRFLPWTRSAFVYALLVKQLLPPPNETIVDYLVRTLNEVFLIKMNGISSKSGFVNGPTWTISSMLIVEFVMYYLWTRHNKLLVEFIVPVSIVGGIGLWINLQNANFTSWIGFTTQGTFRTWIVYCAGYLSYRLAKQIRDASFNMSGRIILTVIEVTGYILSVVIMMTRNSIYYQWLITVIFAVSIAISFSGISFIEVLLSGKWFVGVCGCLGKLSFSVFLIHNPIVYIYSKHLPIPQARYSYKWLFLLCVMACAVLQLIIIPPVVKLIKRFWTWLKQKLVVQSCNN